MSVNSVPQNSKNLNSVNVKRVFLGVYGAISIATALHTAWGFGTIMGETPQTWLGWLWWWFIGALAAFAVDVGMGAIVWAMVEGYASRWLTRALFVLACFSAYAQLVYSAHHAADYQLGTVATWLTIPLQYVLDARVVILPFVLPLFALVYAFAAHDARTETAVILQEPEQVKTDDKPVEIASIAETAKPPQTVQYRENEPKTAVATKAKLTAAEQRKNKANVLFDKHISSGKNPDEAFALVVKALPVKERTVQTYLNGKMKQVVK